MAHRSLTR